jgi:HEAT repeat protein
MSAPLEKLLRDARNDLVLSRIEKDPSIINDVIGHLENQIRSIKFNSISVLGELGEKSVDGIPKLISCLDDQDWSIIREAARALGKIGNKAENAISRLSELLTNEEESIRKESAIALGKIGSPSPGSLAALVNTLTDKSEIVRTEAVIAIGELGSDAYEAIPDLMKSIKDISWTVRTASAQSISKIGKDTTKAIPSLIIALQDKDWRVRYRVVNTLIQIGEPAIPNLLNELDNKNPIVRSGAIEALGEIRKPDPVIIEKLVIMLKDKKEKVRGKAADSLFYIGKDAVPGLLTALKSAKKDMQKIIISAIARIGKEAEGAISELSNIIGLKGKEIEFGRRDQLYSKSIAARIKSMFSALLGSFSASIRVEATRALGNIGMGSQEATSALVYALSDPKYIVRRAAALSLGKLGSSSDFALNSLIRALDDRNPDVRWRASEALGIVGVKTDEILSRLNVLIHDKCDYVCESAINAIDYLTEE